MAAWRAKMGTAEPWNIQFGDAVPIHRYFRYNCVFGDPYRQHERVLPPQHSLGSAHRPQTPLPWSRLHHVFAHASLGTPPYRAGAGDSPLIRPGSPPTAKLRVPPSRKPPCNRFQLRCLQDPRRSRPRGSSQLSLYFGLPVHRPLQPRRRNGEPLMVVQVEVEDTWRNMIG